MANLGSKLGKQQRYVPPCLHMNDSAKCWARELRSLTNRYSGGGTGVVNGGSYFETVIVFLPRSVGSPFGFFVWFEPFVPFGAGVA